MQSIPAYREYRDFFLRLLATTVLEIHKAQSRAIDRITDMTGESTQAAQNLTSHERWQNIFHTDKSAPD